MAVLRDDDPFARLKTRFEDEEVEKLVCLDESSTAERNRY